MGDPVQERLVVAGKVASAFAETSEVKAACVGGSTAEGLADRDSDLEIVFLCSPDKVPLKARMRTLSGLSDDPQEVSTYSWGERTLEFLVKDGISVEAEFKLVSTVESLIASANGEEACERRKPFDHYGYAVLSDVHYWRVLLDKDGLVAGLKERAVFPESLRRMILKQGRFFEDPHVIYEHQRACVRGDPPYAMRCLNRIIDHFTQIAFALNRRPYTGDKRVLRIMKDFKLPSAEFFREFEALVLLAGDPASLARKNELVHDMFAELKAAVERM